jgi:hypothetical protein
MNDVSAQIEVATLSMAQRQDKLEGQQALKLIDVAGAGQKLSAPPPPPSQPVSVTPKAGSTIEVVA